MSGEPRTLDEWRRASEIADAELESFDRRMAARIDLPDPADWRGIAAHVAAVRRMVEYDLRREALVNAAEDARLGLLAAIHAAEAGEPTRIPPRSADRVRQCREAVARMLRDGDRVTISALSVATGVSREAITGYVRKGWLRLD